MTTTTMTHEEVEANRDLYERRTDELAPEGTHIGPITTPAADSSPEAFAVFHELMTDHGWLGIEYAQEGLHAEGGRYFDDMAPDDPWNMMEDFKRYKQIAEEDGD